LPLQNKLNKAIKDNIEIIETERYNAKDPFITIDEKDSIEQVIIKTITSERTGAPVKIGKETINPSEDLAQKNFTTGFYSLNSWQFRKSLDCFNDAASHAYDPLLQQRINLLKQLHSLLNSILLSNAEDILRSLSTNFDDLLKSLSKYDLLELEEKKHYEKAIDGLYKICCELKDNNTKIKSQQFLGRCSISLQNKESLAAYIWLYKIYLLNKIDFDKIAKDDEILQDTLKNFSKFIEIQTGLNANLEEIKNFPSAYDLNTIFIDYLNIIYKLDFLEETRKNFSIPIFRKSQ